MQIFLIVTHKFWKTGLARQAKMPTPICKEWPKSILAKNLNRWKDKLKTWDNYIVLNKEKLKNIKLTQENLKEKANNLSEQLSKWVDKATYNKNNWIKSENNSKDKEERAHLLKLLS